MLRTLRETLYDLRTDVRDDQDIGATMEHFLDRVRERSDLEHRARSSSSRAGCRSCRRRSCGGSPRRR